MKKTAFTLLISLLPALAAAEPVVAPGGKPGVATSWKEAGGALVLSLAEGANPKEVADAIAKGVPGAKCAVKDRTVSVSGVPAAKLLVALEKIDVTSELDDIDGAFAALKGGADDDSGSSIRATSNATIPGPEAKVVTAKVLAVHHRQFPFVALTVLADGEKLTVVPRIVAKKGLIAADDTASQKNVSAWYARPGDQVKLSLVAHDKVWVADSFERIK